MKALKYLVIRVAYDFYYVVYKALAQRKIHRLEAGIGIDLLKDPLQALQLFGLVCCYEIGIALHLMILQICSKQLKIFVERRLGRRLEFIALEIGKMKPLTELQPDKRFYSLNKIFRSFKRVICSLYTQV